MATQMILSRTAQTIKNTNHFRVVPIILPFDKDKLSSGLFKINLAIAFITLYPLDNKERYFTTQK